MSNDTQPSSMLTEIHIKNFTIVESAQVNFHRGFHVISGETGSGKSVLLQALAFALGERVDADTLRAGAEEAMVTMVLEVEANPDFRAHCESLGLLVPEDGLFFLKRTLNSAGRSRAWVNDEPVTLKTLQGLGERWVHLVRQHAARRLLEEDVLLSLLDRFGGHEAELVQFQKTLSVFREAARNYDELNERVQKTRQQEEFLRYQCDELQKAQLRAGEEAELEALKARLKHRATLAQHSFGMQEILVESEDSVSDRLGKALGLAQKGRQLDETLGGIAEAISAAMGSVQEAARSLSDYLGQLEDPAELDSIEDRLARLAELQRKYQKDEVGLLELAQDLQINLNELENFEGCLEAKLQEKNNASAALKKVADRLHGKRQDAAKRLEIKLSAALKALALPHARIQFRLLPLDSLEAFKNNGGDGLSLELSFNPGEAPRPFEEIVSGGELSRLLLAFYEIVFPADQIGTFIFDEVDTGVGGKVAELMGRRLAALSAKTQVLCVTHLPQIACHADWQFVVEKEVKQKRTYSKIRELLKGEREQEIARMLAGVEVTEQALRHARELLKNAAA